MNAPFCPGFVSLGSAAGGLQDISARASPAQLPACLSWHQSSAQGSSCGRFGRTSPLLSIAAGSVTSAASKRRTARASTMWPFTSRTDPSAIAKYFKGKVVWITGASGGFGEAIAVELCRLAPVKGLILSARSKDQLERVRGRCLDAGQLPKDSVSVLLVDLSALESLPEKVKEANAVFGRIDVLVNNGGVGFRGLSWESSLDLDQEVMRVDYFSGVCLVKALLPAWMEARQGHVVQVASVQGFFGLPGRTAYSAAKHAAVGFYDSLRAEVADFGINVTTVCPGYIRTGHSANAVRTSSGYPEGHTNKGVEPVPLAIELLTAAARQQGELVPAAIDARAARFLRTCCPNLLFAIMRKRARKERRNLMSEDEGAPLGKTS